MVFGLVVVVFAYELPVFFAVACFSLFANRFAVICLLLSLLLNLSLALALLCSLFVVVGVCVCGDVSVVVVGVKGCEWLDSEEQVCVGVSGVCLVVGVMVVC
mgnify:CR=1 FL=1